MVEFNAKITVQDMYRFNLHHAYTSSQGAISIMAGIVGIGAAFMSFGSVTTFYTMAYAVLGILFLLYLPVTLYYRSKAQITMSPVLQNELHYCLTDEGIEVSTSAVEEDNTATLLWENIYKISTTKRALLIFSSRVNAYIIPKEYIANQKEDIYKVMVQHVEPHRLTFRW